MSKSRDAGLILLTMCVLHAAFAAESTAASKAQMKALQSAMEAKLKDADSAKSTLM